MTDEQLIAEGEKLAKPCFMLTEEPQDGEPVAYWGGPGRPDIPAEFPSFVTAFTERRHWITVDGSAFAHLRYKMGFELTGTLSVYEDERTEGGTVGAVFHEPGMNFKELKMDGIPLYAKQAQSFPPIEAVCLYGSSQVSEWLASQGLERHDYEAIRNERYLEVWRQRCPLYTDNCAAVLGGWHVMWPEDAFYMPPEMKLIIWTFKDSEPWMELWRGARNFDVKFRIT